MENKTRNNEEELKTMAKYLRQYCNESECEHCIFCEHSIFTVSHGCKFVRAPITWNLED